MHIFLDIDGVLNPFGRKRTSDWPDAEEYIIEARLGEFCLLLSRELGARLASLPATILWVSTWEHESCLVGDIVGIEAEYLPLGPGWKLRAVQDYLRNNPAPYVWLDDDEADYWANGRLGEMFPELPRYVHQPSPVLGLTKDRFSQIEQFVLENQDWS